MDMKKILQALDGVAERKVEGANDMKKFLSIVTKEPSKEPVKQTLSESVITSFDEDTIGGDANSFLIAADNINDLVMGNVDKIKINADERLLKDMMEKFNSFMTAYHAVGKEILQPDMFDDVQVEEKQSEGIPNGLAFKDYFALEEGKNKIKGVDGKACWDGYKRMGTKKKGGKTVDNCVPTGKK
jgi:hypothetical protein